MSFSWDKIEHLTGPLGLLAVLVFPIMIGIPLIGYLIETVAIFFMILFSFRKRYRLLAISAIGSLTLAIVLMGPSILVISAWAKAIVPGILFGSFLESGLSASRAFIISLTAITIIVFLLFWQERAGIAQELDKIQGWIASGFGGTSPQALELNEIAGKTIAMIKRLMPAFMMLSVVAQLFVGWMLLIIMLRAMGEYFPGIIDFYFWKMPDYYVFIVGLIIALRLLGGETLKIVADNMILFIGFFYAAFGFALFEYYLKKIKLSLFLRILFYIGILFLQLPGLVLAAAVGLFDSYFDFRNVKAKLIG